MVLAINLPAFPAPAGDTATKKPAKSSSKPTRKKSASAQAAERKRVVKAAEAERARRMNKAFVASADLKPMARQVFETHSKGAYAGVEKYASKHEQDAAGGLAWLALGIAHYYDAKPDYAKSIAALRRAKPQARDLGDGRLHPIVGKCSVYPGDDEIARIKRIATQLHGGHGNIFLYVNHAHPA